MWRTLQCPLLVILQSGDQIFFPFLNFILFGVSELSTNILLSYVVPNKKFIAFTGNLNIPLLLFYCNHFFRLSRNKVPGMNKCLAKAFEKISGVNALMSLFFFTSLFIFVLDYPYSNSSSNSFF